MHAYLIVGGDRETRRGKLEELLSQNGIGRAAGERFNLGGGGEDSLKIEDIREAEKWVNLKRNQPVALVVDEADQLTLPAQHAFLKTLEEPGDNILIVLTAADGLSLLATIRSRCKIIRLPTGVIKTAKIEQFRKLLTSTAAERLVGLYPILKEITGSSASLHRGTIKRDEAVKFLESLIVSLRQYRHPERAERVEGSSEAIMLSAAVTAHRRLKNNLNPTLTLHQFILDIPPD